MSRPPLFIHIPKTAGQAVVTLDEVTKVNHSFMNKDVESVDPTPRLDPFFKHIPYSYLSKERLSEFDKVFTVIRNPWSRAVSLYYYADKIRPQPGLEWFNQPKISFEEFLDRRNRFEKTTSFYRLHPYDQWSFQSDWISQEDNIDILTFENLEEDLSFYLGKKISLDIVNKGVYDQDYRYYYNDDTAKIIYDWFKVDIDRWGFTFDSPATKNYWIG